jgi:hypothetical protein
MEDQRQPATVKVLGKIPFRPNQDTASAFRYAKDWNLLSQSHFFSAGGAFFTKDNSFGYSAPALAFQPI